MRALISGAGTAGLSLAFWLRRHGFTVTVVERSSALRPGGHAIDIRGAALEVVSRMGLLEEIRRARTGYRGMSMLDGDGDEIFRSTESTYSGGRFDNDDVELLREDLTRILFEHTLAEYIFGDSITALREHADGVHVTFERSEPRDFDLVIGADGLHSTVRRLAFGPEERFVHPLGQYIGIYTMDNFLGLEDWQTWLRDGDAGYGIFTTRDNTRIKVFVGFDADPIDYDHRDVEQQKRIVAEHCAALRWETPRLLKGMWEAPDFYFDAMAQVRMDHWSTGRISLIGDAACCPSPMSGQGTSLALVGAHVLAEELGKATDHKTAFARYEARMRPFAEANQALALENPGGPASDESVERAKNAIAL
ncbi:FAD-dependent monooxygenase [Thermomonospora cellulosilytica]|uniref:2-polyprenyl-6-methoxyphenol hydroxylase-like FAD-dependent oxidoreductase n=1 Tax=Thermomonospora cellulosilytica TaxID=1411118 RepID=A0A7W3N0C3_9ACTN|nr:FAD-dependent monooxygenase [Thermomonospora cellulosilytica]MBA9005185.1 2-polyprenyl-6-methoxyphenol hydroxylase-like FAD-dependent oxidoreductase [Thermomonospora cellulosilytica]